MERVYNPGIKEYFVDGSGFVVLIATAVLILSAFIKEVVKIICNKRKKKNQRNVNFTNTVYKDGTENGGIEISSIKQDLERINKNTNELRAMIASIDKKISNLNT